MVSIEPFDPSEIGPIATAFFEDLRYEPLACMGPIGSAKTSTALMKFLLRARLQVRSPVDGIRYTKGIVIRDNYRELAKTTLKTWHQWVPENIGKKTGGGNEPVKHHIQFQPNENDKSDIVDLQMEFVGLGDNSVESACRGWEGSFAYLNEADTMTPDVLTYIRGRLRRYPNKKHGFCTFPGLWLDYNAPDEDNWVYDKFHDKLPKGWGCLVQPGARDVGAENLNNLAPGYYEDQIEGAEDWYVRRMIDNQFGYSRDGDPVYKEYRDSIHCAPEALKFIPSLPVGIGADQGRHPAIILAQELPSGQHQIFHEICGDGVGAETFARIVNKEMQEVCQGARLKGWGDPAGGHGSDHDESNWLEIISHYLGVRLRPAPVPNNDLLIRLESVRKPLNELIDGKPGLIISPTCRILRKGFNSMYRYKRVALAGGHRRFNDVPEKNEYSQPHDALQYYMLGSGEGMAARGRKPHGMGQGGTVNAAHGFNPFGKLL